MIEQLIDPLLAFLFPRPCRVCGASVERHSDGPACAECWASVRVFDGDGVACAKCGQPLSDRHSVSEARCSRCVTDYYDRVASAADYGFAAKAVVLSLKDEPHICARAERLLTDRFDRSGFQSATLIVPVPLSRKRLARRGFNQAEILAACLEKHTGIRYRRTLLTRTADFQMHRAGMDKKAREVTVSGAFALTDPHSVKEQRILLVDDVFTTGSTASACAKVLKGAGAAEVNVLTLARAPYYY